MPEPKPATRSKAAAKLGGKATKPAKAKSTKKGKK